VITDAIMTSPNGLHNPLRSGNERGKYIDFIAKWITDIDSRNRFVSDLYMVSVAFKF